MSNVQSILESHPHWSAVETIYHTLRSHGYKAFLAGGCVRDALLGLVANDLDVATDATPHEIEKLFEKTVAVGKNFGVMRVLLGDADIEVATFRSDGAYLDGRRPEGVEFSTPEMDAERRDFTVNALFFDLDTKQILDFVHGQEDLAKRILTTVGNPEQRFTEDHLRLLRAARFVGQLNFELSPATAAALKKMSTKVTAVSGERLHEEMDKLLRSPAVDKALDVMVKSELMKVLFRFRAQDASTDFLPLAVLSWQRFALFFRKASLPEVRSQLHSLRFSVKDQRAIERVLELWQQPLDFFRRSLGNRLLKMDEEGIPWALTVLKAQNQFRPEIEAVEAQWQSFQQQLPKPLLTGADVQGLEGKAIGTCLAQAFELQLERKINSREEALVWLQNYQQKV